MHATFPLSHCVGVPPTHVSMQVVELAQVKEHEIPAAHVMLQPDVRLQTASHAPLVQVVEHTLSVASQVDAHGELRQMTPQPLVLAQDPPSAWAPAPAKSASKS